MRLEKLIGKLIRGESNIAHIPIEYELSFVQQRKKGFSIYKSNYDLLLYDAAQKIFHATLECIVRDSKAQLFLDNISVGTFDVQFNNKSDKINKIPFIYETAPFPEPNFTLIRFGDQQLQNHVLYDIVQKDSSSQYSQITVALLDNHAIADLLNINLRSASSRIEKVKSRFAVHQTKSKHGIKHVLLVPSEDAAKVHRHLTPDKLTSYVQTVEIIEADKVKAEAEKYKAHYVVLNGEEYYFRSDVEPPAQVTYQITSIGDHHCISAAHVDVPFLISNLGVRREAASRHIRAALKQFAYYKTRYVSGGLMKTVLLVESKDAALVYPTLTLADDVCSSVSLYSTDSYDRQNVIVNGLEYYIDIQGKERDETEKKRVRKPKQKKDKNAKPSTDKAPPFNSETFLNAYREHYRTAKAYASSLGIANGQTDEFIDAAFLLLYEQGNRNDLEKKLQGIIDNTKESARSTLQIEPGTLSYLKREERELFRQRYCNGMSFLDLKREFSLEYNSIVDIILHFAEVRAKVKEKNPDLIEKLKY